MIELMIKGSRYIVILEKSLELNVSSVNLTSL